MTPGAAAADAARAGLQRLLVVAAALALLGHGGATFAPRLLAAGASVAAERPVIAERPTSGGRLVAASGASRPAAESAPVDRGTLLRHGSALLAAAGGGEPAAGPGSSALVDPHLVAGRVLRAPTTSYAPAPGREAGGRAPPGPAGT